ncbi:MULTISPECIES: GNAT family N-acetyltransferase [Microbacterium]|uniref:GNAT family N-acetyltransferase n=1 Tax=Microbacterium TaxID=33882 RepID=UPI00146CDE0B|nr:MULTISPECIES: GNAT family N-acetyltransferase [Microbacterium]
MEYTVRRAEGRDAERIAELHVITWKETYTDLLPEGFLGDEHVQMRRTMWRRILDDDRDEWTVRVVEDSSGSTIGFAMAGPALGDEEAPLPRERQLYTLYVMAAHHGRGAGQSLLDAVLGAEPAMLWVAAQNPRAMAFYRRNGFAPDGAEQIDPGAPAITDVRMLR